MLVGFIGQLQLFRSLLGHLSTRLLHLVVVVGDGVDVEGLRLLGGLNLFRSRSDH